MMDISRKDKGLNIALRGTLGIHLVCWHRSVPGADPHRFPPLYGNWSDFS